MKRLLYKIFLFSVIIISWSLVSMAQRSQYNFQTIGGGDGLSANNVKSIVRDKLGFMWFGTKNGLNRYSGSDIKVYNVYDENRQMGNNNIGALYVDNDSVVWIGTDRGIYQYDPRRDCIEYVDIEPECGQAPTNWVQRITGDSKGNVWALLPDNGVYKYKDNSVKAYLPIQQDAMKTIFPSDICVSQDGNVWVVTSGNGIMKYDSNADRFVHINARTSDKKHEEAYRSLSAICEGPNGNLLVGTPQGIVFEYNPIEDILTPLPVFGGRSVYLRCIECFDDELWIGTHNGLCIRNLSTGKMFEMKEDVRMPFSIPDNTIYTIYRDNEGGAWIGTMFGGASYMSRRKFSFTSYGMSSGLSSRLVLGISADRHGDIWIGTETAGVNVLNPQTGEIRHLKNFNTSDPVVISMTSSDGDVITGFSRSGLYRSHSSEGRQSLIFPTDKSMNGDVYSYLKDSKGNEWVGLGYSLYRRGKGEKNFLHIQETAYDWIYYLYETSDGIIWMGTMGNGVWRHDPSNGSFKAYVFDAQAAEPSGLCSNSINSIMEDSEGNVWLSTDRGGLSRYNPDTDNFTTFGIKDGFPDDVVYGVLEDKRKNLWFGTNHGLVRFTPATGKVLTFTNRDGIPFNQFNYKSAIKSADGLFYMGGINGLISFNPEDLEESLSDDMPFYFTSLKVLNKDIFGDTSNTITNGSVLFADKITLDYDQSIFSLTVASPNFRHLGDVNFAYRLLPANSEWIDMRGHNISFSNLSPGKYSLEVRAYNGHCSSIRTISINILPPWWESIWAQICYAVLLLGCVVAGVLLWQRRNARIMREREKAFHESKERELYRSKVAFFIEIAHEIRTPLSLIDLPLEAIEEMGSDNMDIMRYVKVSRQNAKRLLELTGQLLDFQKIDSKKLTLKSENVCVNDCVRSIADRFEPSIALTGKHLECHIDTEPLVVSVDREALTKIISNLLNNARKYAVQNIVMTMTRIHDAYGDKYQISVSSDGKKISAEERNRIFMAFYQADSDDEYKDGVGIGLPLSHSLATLLGGTLELEEDTGEINVFTLSLPFTEPTTFVQTTPQEIDEYVMEKDSNQTKERSEVFSVLLVEDNEGISNFIAEQLRSDFIVETAANGVEALDMIGKTPYDIIVTDIMMPEMDGLELCASVKSNIDISHIPIVFMTAKNDIETKVKGLQLGGEAYVEKPFSIKYLKQLIKSLLENRKRSRESFQKNPFFSVSNMQMNKSNEEFINKVYKIIEDNISDEDFNVDMMCDRLAMSRSSLLRKMKSLFNLSPAELIRLIKLKKAANLIQQGEYLIGDIGYMVGIASPSYFSKIFAKQFGMTPKEFEKQCKEERPKS